TEYIPSNLGLLFNLTFLYLWHSNLIEIKSQDFNGMVELFFLELRGNKLTFIP
ncbi:unnamed protein product, partial [Diamesa serratosioi]